MFMFSQSQKMDLCAILEPNDFIISDLTVIYLAIEIIILF